MAHRLIASLAKGTADTVDVRVEVWSTVPPGEPVAAIEVLLWKRLTLTAAVDVKLPPSITVNGAHVDLYEPTPGSWKPGDADRVTS